MNAITQYRPAYFSGFENATVEFESTADLLEIPFVKNFVHNLEKPFHRFSMTKSEMGGPSMLMAEYDDGHVWWVVGHFRDVADLDLPEWKHKKREGAE